MNETHSQPGNCPGGHTRISWAPSSENNPAIVPDEASTGEMISGPPQSGQPGNAIGHAVGKLTLRHGLGAGCGAHCLRDHPLRPGLLSPVYLAGANPLRVVAGSNVGTAERMRRPSWAALDAVARTGQSVARETDRTPYLPAARMSHLISVPSAGGPACSRAGVLNAEPGR